jgi:cyclic beta-1,2-glucan synthetase
MLVRDAERVVLLLWPPFDGTLHDPGYIAAYPPGVRENGGQYTHAATWLGWAHAKLGDGDRAGRVMRLLSPVLHATTPEAARHYQIEPYVLAGDVCGTAPYAGRGGWSWYTGAAAWMWRLGVEAILGIRREADVLRIDPCIPRGWPRFEAWLRLGTERLHIVVDNPDGVSSGVSAMTVDGASVRANTLPVGHVGLQPDGASAREVRVLLGAPRAVGERELGSPELPLRPVLETTASERA